MKIIVVPLINGSTTTEFSTNNESCAQLCQLSYRINRRGVKYQVIPFIPRLSVKETVARDFLASVFFHGSALYGPQISRLKGFSFIFRFREVIQIFR